MANYIDILCNVVGNFIDENVPITITLAACPSRFSMPMYIKPT